MKILCVCSAGRNRSRHLARFLHSHGYETDFAGVHPLSLNKITQHRIDWAEVIITVSPWMTEALEEYDVAGKKVVTLDYPNDPQVFPKMEEEALQKLGRARQ